MWHLARRHVPRNRAARDAAVVQYQRYAPVPDWSASCGARACRTTRRCRRCAPGRVPAAAVARCCSRDGNGCFSSQSTSAINRPLFFLLVVGATTRGGRSAAPPSRPTASFGIVRYQLDHFRCLGCCGRGLDSWPHLTTPAQGIRCGRIGGYHNFGLRVSDCATSGGVSCPALSK